MNGKILTIILLIFIDKLTICQSKKYFNYSLYNVLPTKNEHVQFLRNLNYKRYIGLTFWKRPYKLYENVQFVVSPVDEELFIERARDFTVNPQLLIRDIQEAFDNQTFSQYKKSYVDSYNWDGYHTYEDVHDWLVDIEVKYGDFVQLTSIGKSAEGRDIHCVIIRKKVTKNKVIVEGGIHANEWISVEFVTYLLDQLVRIDEKSHWKMTNLLAKYEWHLIPIVNPDGYIYNQNQDRFWRKNRKPYKNSVGVDLNRNFDYNFGRDKAIHTENDDQYCGPKVFSEPESAALAKYITNKSHDLKFYFSIHGYGQKIIIPFIDKKRRNDNYAEAANLGKLAIWKMWKQYGVHYNIGTGYQIFGVRISGNSASYVKKNHDVRFVYTILLRDNGTYGHALPPSMILPTCREMVTGISELMNSKYKKVKLQLFNGNQRSIGTMFLILFCAVFVL